MFNSFHLQSECYPNYITLIPSLSCFNRSVVVIDLYRSLYISFQPECWLNSFRSHSFSISFKPEWFRSNSHSLIFSILVFQPTKILAMFLVPLAEWSMLNIVHLRRVISSSFATSQGSWFHSFVKEATLFYLFLFRFSPAPSLDLGSRSLVSGGEL